LIVELSELNFIIVKQTAKLQNWHYQTAKSRFWRTRGSEAWGAVYDVKQNSSKRKRLQSKQVIQSVKLQTAGMLNWISVTVHLVVYTHVSQNTEQFNKTKVLQTTKTATLRASRHQNWFNWLEFNGTFSTV